MVKTKKLTLKETVIKYLEDCNGAGTAENILKDIEARGEIVMVPKGFQLWGNTVRFWETNKSLIKKALTEYCEKENENFVQVIANWEPDFSDYEIAKAVCGRYDYHLDAIYNRLSFFALEYAAKQP